MTSRVPPRRLYDVRAVSIVSVVICVGLIALSLNVAFCGLKTMRLSIFLSAVSFVMTMLDPFSNVLVSFGLAFAVGLALSLVPALRKGGLVVIGMAFGAKLVNLVYTAVAMAFSLWSYDFLYATWTVMSLVALCCGWRALGEQKQFMIIATSVTGGFTASSFTVATALAFSEISPTTYIVLLFVVGAVFAVAGAVNHIAALKRGSRDDNCVVHAHPVGVPVDDATK